MNLRKLIFTENACYKAGRKITPKGIMVHSTGANNPNLRRYVGPDDGLLGVNQYNNHWNQDRPDGRQVCVHAFIGKLKDGSIATYQTLPWNHRGWHAGGDANNTHIGFEICEDGLTDASYFNAVYKEAVELCAYLCKEYKLDPMAAGTIIGHYEGYQRGIASNHADPRHWFSRHGKSMATFRTEVKKLLSANEPPAGGSENTTYPEKLTTGYYRVRKTWADAKSQLGAYRILSNAKAQVDKNPGYYVFNNDGMIVYPTGSTSSPTYKEYTVVKGDSLWAIAAKLLGSGTRYTEIVKLNNLKSTIIYTGQKLKIPN